MLVQSLPENQLYFIIDIIKGLSKLIPVDSDDINSRENAFRVFENLKKKIPDLNYDKELAEYREERYN